MNSYILIGIESFIDHIGSIRDMGIAYWKKKLNEEQAEWLASHFV